MFGSKGIDHLDGKRMALDRIVSANQEQVLSISWACTRLKSRVNEVVHGLKWPKVHLQPRSPIFTEYDNAGIESLMGCTHGDSTAMSDSAQPSVKFARMKVNHHRNTQPSGNASQPNLPSPRPIRSCMKVDNIRAI